MRICSHLLCVSLAFSSMFFGQDTRADQLNKQQQKPVAASGTPKIYIADVAVELGASKSEFVEKVLEKFEVTNEKCISDLGECFYLRSKQGTARATIWFKDDRITRVRHVVAPSLRTPVELVQCLTIYLPPEKSVCTMSKGAVEMNCCSERYVNWTCSGVTFWVGDILRSEDRWMHRVEFGQSLEPVNTSNQ